ncbi:MAG TPA: Gfo/Idh/MocA family oxidoreductase [Gemmataceae bacterium]|jgi:predicted dehydrogenase|nr:Gfo/Idh/MocA family oxidoreductase [Gemmataceae bacterium]
MKFNRRDFLWSSASLAAVAASESLLLAQTPAPTPTPAPTARGNPGDRLNVAVIGIRGRGREHLEGMAGRHNCVVTHICDADSATQNERAVAAKITSIAARQGGVRPEFVQDLHRIMDNPNIQLVTIATPNHWHSLAAIWALQAGKHVYVEKPVSHNIWEGRRLVEASRHYNKLCQAGTQIRSSAGSRAAIEFLHSGALGRVEVARALCYKRRPSIGTHMGEVPIPASVDYNLWCGPAPRRPMNRLHLHYDWHWQWDYGCGDLGNQGIHQMDVARWGLNQPSLCSSTWSVGGRFGYTDDGETANTQLAFMNYGDQTLLFEVRGLVTDNYRAKQGEAGVTVGNVFHCTNGYLVFTNYDTAIAYDKDGTQIRRFSGGGDHFGNFVSAVRANRRQDLHGEIQEGHVSSALCHLANISYRLGQAQAFSPEPTPFGGNAVAHEALERMKSHLTANHVDLATTQLRVGPRLNLDVSAETFLGNADANRMLTREYRQGFEVPARF